MYVILNGVKNLGSGDSNGYSPPNPRFFLAPLVRMTFHQKYVD